MFKLGEVKAGLLAEAGFEELRGKEFLIFGVSDQEAPENNTIVFVKSEADESYRQVREAVFVTREDMELPGLDASCVQLKGNMYKNIYGLLLEEYKKHLPKAEMELVNGSYLSKDLQLGKNVRIAPFCVIGSDVVIGDDCEIGAGTIIKNHVRIGNHVQIQEKCLIGVDDMNVYRLEDGVCHTFPHLAGTVIEDGCLMLAGSVVAAGDSRTTVLGKGAFVGLLGDVGHNCRIGEETRIGGKSSISGHCNIGSQSYTAPMSVTINRMNMGDHVYLGIGAVAIKDIPDGEKLFGNPARKVLEMKKK